MYNILIDYGSEGHRFLTDSNGKVLDFETTNAAVKAAIEFNTCGRWSVVKIIHWEVKPNDFKED